MTETKRCCDNCEEYREAPNGGGSYYACVNKNCPCHVPVSEPTDNRPEAVLDRVLTKVGVTPTPPPTEWEERFIEQGADLEHTRWAKWQAYLYSKCIKNSDGSLTIPAESVAHWQRQIDTPYAELSEREKESDRKEVRTYLPLITQALAEQKARMVEEVEEYITKNRHKIERLDRHVLDDIIKAISR